MPDENSYVEISSVLVNPEIFTRPYTCDVSKYGCNSLCCYRSCLATPEEASRIEEHLDGILAYLPPGNREAIGNNGSVLANCSSQCPTGCVIHEDEARALRRNFNGSDFRCVLLFQNNCSLLYTTSKGIRYCAVHSYALESGMAWEQFKFSDCMQYPLSLFTNEEGKQVLSLQDTPFLQHIPCLRDPAGEPMYKGLRKIIGILLGEEFYGALSSYAEGSPGKKQVRSRRTKSKNANRVVADRTSRKIT